MLTAPGPGQSRLPGRSRAGRGAAAAGLDPSASPGPGPGRGRTRRARGGRAAGPAAARLTLVADGLLALQAVGQVGAAGEHPGLARRRLAGGRRGAEGAVAAGARRAGELAREVHGEGAEALLLVRVRASPARLLLDEGVRGQRAVGGGRREVQHGRPLRGAADRHGAASAAARPAARPAAAQRRHRLQQRVEVPHVGAHAVAPARQPLARAALAPRHLPAARLRRHAPGGRAQSLGRAGLRLQPRGRRQQRQGQGALQRGVAVQPACASPRGCGAAPGPPGSNSGARREEEPGAPLLHSHGPQAPKAGAAALPRSPRQAARAGSRSRCAVSRCPRAGAGPRDGPSSAGGAGPPARPGGGVARARDWGRGGGGQAARRRDLRRAGPAEPCARPSAALPRPQVLCTDTGPGGKDRCTGAVLSFPPHYPGAPSNALQPRPPSRAQLRPRCLPGSPGARVCPGRDGPRRLSHAAACTSVPCPRPKQLRVRRG